MNKEIKFFKIDWTINSDLNIFLSNAKTNNINLLFIESSSLQNLPLSNIQNIFEIIKTKQTPLMIVATKGQLKARLEVTYSYIKLFPESPFQMRLHRDEETPSVDYVAYLGLLLTLCKDLDIDALGTKENLYDYLGPT